MQELGQEDIVVMNEALSMLGHSTIQSLDQLTKESRKVVTVYVNCLNYQLASHTWRFSIGRVKLIRDDYTPPFEWRSRMLLPNDFIRLGKRDKYDNRILPSPCDRFSLEGKNICLLYTSPSPRDRTRSRMPSSA